MSDTGAYIAGEITNWPSLDRMAALLRDAGLRVVVGRYSIRVEDCSHFVFREYGGDLGEPQIDADADSVEAMRREGKLVSDALARAGIRHRFEIYDARDDLAGYLHHDWDVREETRPMPDTTTYRRFHGSCHCGNIRITLDWPDSGSTIPVRACGCTLCTKHRAVWTSHPDGRFDLRIADDSRVMRYRFGTKTADFHICSTCGVVPIVTCIIEGARYAVVNVNTFDDVDRSRLVETARDFEGETTEARLARRRRSWTPEIQGAISDAN